MKQQNVIAEHIKTLMEKSYIDYAMSVITDRAMPDIRDGLKPVHRRILWAMYEAGNHHNKAYRKSARMVGDVIGKYHPHGDTSVYDAAVRMAQPFSMNAALVDGQGNFGSIDGDNPAAMRYTEIRLTKLASEMFGDIDKETVAWHENYDGSEKEPEVLTVPYPHLLVNGSEGIAVGMATSMPPHNLSAVVDATITLLMNPDTDCATVRTILQGPDFPTKAIVHGLDGFADAVETGKGRVKLRAVWHEEERSRGAKSIIIDELPYQVNKAKLVMKIADLVRKKEVEGIVNLRDESDNSIRVVIELRKDEDANVIFSTLCAKTELEISFSYNCVVLDHGIPKQLGLRDILLKWIEFRLDVVLKRHIFDRKQALAKLHLLDGYMLAMSNMDAVISTIRQSSNGEEAKRALIELINVDEIQVDAILALRLQKLTSMELDSIRSEHLDVSAKVEKLTAVIDSRDMLVSVVLEELENVKDKYGHPRMTEISHNLSAVLREDMITREDVVIVLTRNGYIKRIPADSLNAQNRGTRGKRSVSVGDDDEISAIYQLNTHDTILVFDESGRVYARKGYEIPECSLVSRGRHIANVIEGFDKSLASILKISENASDASVVIVTKNGLVKRSLVEEYMSSRINNSGALGVTILPNDSILNAFVATPGQHIILVSSNGKTIRFDLNAVREIGRTGQGVRGISLEEDCFVVGAHVIDAESTEHIVCIGDKGVGKRTPVSDFKVQARGGQGATGFKITAKTGNLIAALGADESKDIVMLSSNGVSNRIAVSDIRDSGRSTSGVILMNLDKGQTVVAVTTVLHDNSDDQAEDNQESIDQQNNEQAI